MGRRSGSWLHGSDCDGGSHVLHARPERGGSPVSRKFQPAELSRSGNAVLYEGKVERSLGQLGDAENHYRDSIKTNPNYPNVQIELGLLLLRRGRNDAAAEMLATAASNFPGEVTAQIEWAKGLLQLKRWEEAGRVLEKLQPRAQRVPRIAYLSGMLRLHEGRYEEAARWFGQAVGVDPNDEQAWYQLANAQTRLGNDAAAREALEKFESLYRAYLANEKLRGNASG